MRKLVVVLTFVSISAFLLQFMSCNDDANSAGNRNVKEGFALAQKYCSSCHLFPEPDLLDKATWAGHVLPKMGALLGFRPFASDYIKTDTDQNFSLEQWRNIVRYYVSLAPENLAPSTSLKKIKAQLPGFKVEVPEVVTADPSTTMVKFEPLKKVVLFGDGLNEYIYTLSANEIIDSLKIGVGVSNLHITDSSFFVLTMGVLYPTDERAGKLSMIEAGTKKSIVLLDSLQRPVHAAYADLNGDAREDIILCEFGNSIGQLSWCERTSEGKFIKHVLRTVPGAVRTEVYDFNKDGRTDIIALMAQGDEGFFIFYNQGKGKFKEERVIRLPPSYGSNYFELIDFNNDGFPDILASNGDNGDYPPILKGYHGIRIYINNKKNQFSEKLYLPVHGVGKVVARDFNADGEIDLASISYFPDYNGRPEESFICWLNKGHLEFEPHSFGQATSGRWLTMDANDADGDGDIDIVLGNAKFTVGAISPELMSKWDLFNSSVLILRNTIR